jgi:hypothetical protein
MLSHSVLTGCFAGNDYFLSKVKHRKTSKAR